MMGKILLYNYYLIIIIDKTDIAPNQQCARALYNSTVLVQTKVI